MERGASSGRRRGAGALPLGSIPAAEKLLWTLGRLRLSAMDWRDCPLGAARWLQRRAERDKPRQGAATDRRRWGRGPAGFEPAYPAQPDGLSGGRRAGGGAQL